MPEPAHHVPVRLLLPRINAKFFCVCAWICKTMLYICYVNNDKQTHNDMYFEKQTYITLPSGYSYYQRPQKDGTIFVHIYNRIQHTVRFDFCNTQEEVDDLLAQY